MADRERPRPLHEWHEDHGDVLWWLWPIEQPPYVGSPLDCGHTVEVSIGLAASDGHRENGKMRMGVGGWPWADADDETESRLFWTPLPDANDLDSAIRDYIRGGPDPFNAHEEQIAENANCSRDFFAESAKKGEVDR